MAETNLIECFRKLEIRTGTIISARVFKEARVPAYVLEIDFGDYGVKKSSAQIADRYAPDQLVGKQIVAVINFPSKQIANLMSECLVLGAISEEGVSLLNIDHKLQNGLRIG
ncbi:tRNA-binding protein [Marinigracilibium pacificum]|uniref:tRNA-binding protein n=1 Tax=Marinigracilibium pacificum TaxID=2729599 RepID=A0A848J0F0_9BACT|nr:tRNA-binding protein [Marinigracilibium pacificum]NMM50263.1 tRNA-binding protein [Marinigracilibium pacificum]